MNEFKGVGSELLEGMLIGFKNGWSNFSGWYNGLSSNNQIFFFCGLVCLIGILILIWPSSKKKKMLAEEKTERDRRAREKWDNYSKI